MDGILLFLALLTSLATLDNGQCSTCKQFHVESKVTMSAFMSCTLLYCVGEQTVYDEKGRIIPQPEPKPCNTCTRYGMCSRGHSVISYSTGW